MKLSCDKQIPKKDSKKHKKWGGSEVPAKSRPYEHSSSGESLKTHLVSFCPASGAAPYELVHRDFYDGFSLGAPFFMFYPIISFGLILLQRSVAGSCDNIVLLLFCKVDEANCVTRNAYCEVCVLRFFWVSLAVLELLYAEDVYVQVV